MKVLMVCLGNICRSPIAEGILQKCIDEQQLAWHVASAGTSSFHLGQPPHDDSVSISLKNHIDISHQRSRHFSRQDILEYDLIIAMDTSNYNDILRLCETEAEQEKVHMLLNFSFPGENRIVPDPYYEGGFDKVFDMIHHACEQLVEKFHN